MSVPVSVLFVCPHCEKTLRVRPEHVGRKGRCTACGGRIALLGRTDAAGPQRASRVEDHSPKGPGSRETPATEKQLEYLRNSGVPADRLRDLSRTDASEMIERLVEVRRQGEAPTEKQWAYLKRLGATEDQLARIDSKAAASALIEALHLSPTQEQMAVLRELGATGAQLAALRNRAAADALIESMRRNRHSA